MLINILIGSVVGGLFGLLGGLVLLWKEDFARRISHALLSFAVGSMLGAAFLDLLPEAVELKGYEGVAPFLLAGIVSFFLFERVLGWYHSHGHEHNEEEYDHAHDKTVSASVIFGDTLHNFIDGILIALSFSLGREVGIATTLAVFFHEIPQEIGDFGVLLHLGYSRGKVLFYNLVSAIATIVGALLGYVLSSRIQEYIPYLIAFAAGTFVYVAISDLLPEIKHKNRAWDFLHVFGMIAGIVLVHLMGVWFHE